MKMIDIEKNKQADVKESGTPVMVWDLPTRLFHWILVFLVIISFVTGHTGGTAMDLHMQSGYAILVLLLFRLIWGWIGSHTSRFSFFVKGPKTVIQYATALLKKDSPQYLGHNPMGGWSIIALLATLMIQVITGLFANDDILTEGPLYIWVSKSTSDWLTGIHEANQGLITLLVALHVLAVFFYFFYKKENLIRPMITGVKQWHKNTTELSSVGMWRAVGVMAAATFAVYLLVR
ncbi:MAG: cytochrome b/b6 domain-containing protein [Desulfobacteraceae bacterium]|jgi:cytochrome b